MVEEHKNIKRMLKVVRRACLYIMNGKEIDYGDFDKIIDFIKNYADKHHHEKEEIILFDKMVSEIGGPAEKLVKFGMLVEHNLGRLYIKDLEDALIKAKEGREEGKLDVIANAVAYAQLLFRHIDKEDNVAYPFAKRELSLETMNRISMECEAFEAEKSRLGVQNRYIEILELLEEKYK